VSKEQPAIRSDVRYASALTDDPATYCDVLEPIGGAMVAGFIAALI
jgi:hypothetical protein